MKRLLALLLVLGLAGFYIAWPAWSAYQIRGAIKAKDNATLERKIDFPSVRESLKPATIQKIGEIYDRFQSQAGPTGAIIVAQIKNDVVPKIADTALISLVTPANLIRIVNDGGSLKQNAERILQEQVGKIGLPGLGGAGARAPGGAQAPGGVKLPGGLGQIAEKMGIDPKQIPGLGGQKQEGQASGPTPAPAPSGQPAGGPAGDQQPGFANIKRFAILGPLAFEVGVSQDQSAKEPDAVIEMRFVNGDWRVTAVRPRI